MAIITEREYRPLVDEGDPDDYRPNSSIAMVLDPASADGAYVNGLMVLFERMAPGDRIPVHIHTIEELIIIDAGIAGDARPGTAHGWPWRRGLYLGRRAAWNTQSGDRSVADARRLSLALAADPIPGTQPGPRHRRECATTTHHL